jgi:hypothetical protein
MLVSRLDAININIYFEHWHEDHQFEEMNIFLRVWLQEKNSSDGSIKVMMVSCVEPWLTKT